MSACLLSLGLVRLAWHQAQGICAQLTILVGQEVIVLQHSLLLKMRVLEILGITTSKKPQRVLVDQPVHLYFLVIWWLYLGSTLPKVVVRWINLCCWNSCRTPCWWSPLLIELNSSGAWGTTKQLRKTSKRTSTSWWNFFWARIMTYLSCNLDKLILICHFYLINESIVQWAVKNVYFLL